MDLIGTGSAKADSEERLKSIRPDEQVHSPLTIWSSVETRPPFMIIQSRANSACWPVQLKSRKDQKHGCSCLAVPRLSREAAMGPCSGASVCADIHGRLFVGCNVLLGVDPFQRLPGFMEGGRDQISGRRQEQGARVGVTCRRAGRKGTRGSRLADRALPRTWPGGPRQSGCAWFARDAFSLRSVPMLLPRPCPLPRRPGDEQRGPARAAADSDCLMVDVTTCPTDVKAALDSADLSRWWGWTNAAVEGRLTEKAAGWAESGADRRGLIGRIAEAEEACSFAIAQRTYMDGSAWWQASRCLLLATSCASSCTSGLRFSSLAAQRCVMDGSNWVAAPRCGGGLGMAESRGDGRAPAARVASRIVWPGWLGELERQQKARRMQSGMADVRGRHIGEETLGLAPPPAPRRTDGSASEP